MSENLLWLREAMMDRHRPLLSDKVRGVPRADDRRLISGVVHVLESGYRWADAPQAYEPRKTLYDRWRRWAEKRHWLRVFEALANAGGPPAQILIDSSAVLAHRSASGGKGGGGARDRPFAGRANHEDPRARGSLVLPRPRMLSGGQVPDCIAAEPLLRRLPEDALVVMGDKAYGQQRGARADEGPRGLPQHLALQEPPPQAPRGPPVLPHSQRHPAHVRTPQRRPTHRHRYNRRADVFLSAVALAATASSW